MALRQPDSHSRLLRRNFEHSPLQTILALRKKLLTASPADILTGDRYTNAKVFSKSSYGYESTLHHLLHCFRCVKDALFI